MGSSQSRNRKIEKTEEKKSANLDRYLTNLNQQDNKTISLLLLGPSNCGKSTLLRQMEKIYGVCRLTFANLYTIKNVFHKYIIQMSIWFQPILVQKHIVSLGPKKKKTGWVSNLML